MSLQYKVLVRTHLERCGSITLQGFKKGFQMFEKCTLRNEAKLIWDIEGDVFLDNVSISKHIWPRKRKQASLQPYLAFKNTLHCILMSGHQPRHQPQMSTSRRHRNDSWHCSCFGYCSCHRHHSWPSPCHHPPTATSYREAPVVMPLTWCSAPKTWKRISSSDDKGKIRGMN